MSHSFYCPYSLAALPLPINQFTTSKTLEKLKIYIVCKKHVNNM